MKTPAEVARAIFDCGVIAARPATPNHEIDELWEEEDGYERKRATAILTDWLAADDVPLDRGRSFMMNATPHERAHRAVFTEDQGKEAYAQITAERVEKEIRAAERERDALKREADALARLPKEEWDDMEDDDRPECTCHGQREYPGRERVCAWHEALALPRSWGARGDDGGPPSDTVRLLPARPKVVCLCGSTRFMEAFFDEGWRLTLEGVIVLSVGVCKHAEHHGAEALGGDVCERLDELHWRKIDLANEVLVLNVGGYIGESTRAEIDYAKRIGKPVRYLEDDDGGTNAE